MPETAEFNPANASSEKPCCSSTRRFFAIDRAAIPLRM
jgi:hypothetical protein